MRNFLVIDLINVGLSVAVGGGGGAGDDAGARLHPDESLAALGGIRRRGGDDQSRASRAHESREMSGLAGESL